MADENPILNNPYEEPNWHYATNLQGELDYARPVKGRRFFTPEVQTIPVRQGAQSDLMELNDLATDEHSKHNVNLLRREVSSWRHAKYPQTIRITRELLQFWFLNPERDMTQSLFFAQREAIKACRDKRDGDWLLIPGFAFESGITELSRSFGNFQVSIVRMHDDLLQFGLLNKDKKAASFVTIGEPDIKLHLGARLSSAAAAPTATEASKSSGASSRCGRAAAQESRAPEEWATVEIAGLDIYNPIKDEVKSRDVHDIAYWMVDDNYDGSNFVVRQVFFCGGDKDEYDEWKKGLSNLAKASTKKKAEQTLKIEIDDEAFTRLYGHTSHPFPVKKGQKIAVRVISQFGEETTKVLEVE